MEADSQLVKKLKRQSLLSVEFCEAKLQEQKAEGFLFRGCTGFDWCDSGYRLQMERSSPDWAKI